MQSLFHTVTVFNVSILWFMRYHEVRCLRAFHRAVLHFPKAIEAGLQVCSAPLYKAWLLRKPCDLGTEEIADLLEAAAFFGRWGAWNAGIMNMYTAL